jgi:hypothetical protein
MVRARLAAALLLAHCAGLLVLSFGMALMGGAFSLHITFLMGLVMSSAIFLPVLAITLVFAAKVIEHRVLYVVLGPLVVATMCFWYFSGIAMGVAVSAGTSSIALFLLLRLPWFAGSASAEGAV